MPDIPTTLAAVEALAVTLWRDESGRFSQHNFAIGPIPQPTEYRAFPAASYAALIALLRAQREALSSIEQIAFGNVTSKIVTKDDALLAIYHAARAALGASA